MIAHLSRFIRSILPMLILLALVVLSACQAAAPQPTPSPAPSLSPSSTATAQPVIEETAYPLDSQLPVAPTISPAQQTAEAAEAYPAAQEQVLQPGGPGPSGAPAVENRAQVTARLVEAFEGGQDPGLVRLRATILSVQVNPGEPDFTSKLVNTEADLYADAASLPALAPGDTFEAEVSYRGDERGGAYYAVNVKKSGS